MIEINNLTTNSINEKLLKDIAENVLNGENKAGIGLSIVLVGQGKMRTLNKKYRKKNRVTDVLAFEDKIQNLGEIVICLKEVKKNAKRFGLAFEKELSRVLIHGILHLLGYNHEKDKEMSKEMEKKQEYYLSH